MRPPHQQSALRALLPGGRIAYFFANFLNNATQNESLVLRRKDVRKNRCRALAHSDRAAIGHYERTLSR